jgi:hypothetical protein
MISPCIRSQHTTPPSACSAGAAKLACQHRLHSWEAKVNPLCSESRPGARGNGAWRQLSFRGGVRGGLAAALRVPRDVQAGVW